MAKSTARASKPAVKPAEAAQKSVEELLGEVIKACDAFDLFRERTIDRRLSLYGRGDQQSGNLRGEMDRLLDTLRKRVPAEAFGGDFPAWLRERLAAPPGQVPALSRPGEFLLWLGRVPFRCVWGGYPFPDAGCLAADPQSAFPNPYGQWGSQSMTIIDVGVHTVDHQFRLWIVEATKRLTWHKNKQVPVFNLGPLSHPAREETAAYLAANPWLQAALKAGPVDPLPVPRHATAVQLSL